MQWWLLSTYERQALLESSSAEERQELDACSAEVVNALLLDASKRRRR